MSVKELEKFTKYFLIKTVQVIVQSRLGGDRLRKESNPRGNDWFNLSIEDLKEVNDQTKRCLDAMNGDPMGEGEGETRDPQGKEGGTGTGTGTGTEALRKGFNIESRWRFCCEISIKTNEGESMILEHWFVTNETVATDDRTVYSENPSPSSLAIYNVYNNMSLMLKSLVTLTRATPAYKISTGGQSADSYVVCYRVYQTELDFEEVFKEDAQEAEHFTSEIKLGSIRSAFNVLNVSFAYRTDMTPCNRSAVEPVKSPQLLPLKNDHFPREKYCEDIESKWEINKPLAAFASSPSKTTTSFPLLPESPFSDLLTNRMTPDSSRPDQPAPDPRPAIAGKSQPISIPDKDHKSKVAALASSPVYSSSGDSFVFVELKAPFAPEDQNELGSFFNGPSPTFTGSGDLSDQLSDISSQLAALESNIHHWDSFVDSVCCPENEEELAVK